MYDYIHLLDIQGLITVIILKGIGNENRKMSSITVIIYLPISSEV